MMMIAHHHKILKSQLIKIQSHNICASFAEKAETTQNKTVFK